jgi:hypothetical protein
MGKLDGVIEAVRYRGGRIELVRLYERRGATFSDHVVLDRPTLIQRLKQGRRIFTGRRKALLASTFEVGNAVTLSPNNGESIVTSPSANGHDRLDGVPIF